VDVEDAVLLAAQARAAALAAGDSVALTALHHPAFLWISHTGQRFDRDSYLRSNAPPAAKAPPAPEAPEAPEVSNLSEHTTSTRGSTPEGAPIWHSQRLEDVAFAASDHVVVLRCVVADDVTIDGQRRIHRMPCTQTWVLADGRWQLLAGHAGPLLRAAEGAE
jgi:hypothetical protein